MAVSSSATHRLNLLLTQDGTQFLSFRATKLRPNPRMKNGIIHSLSFPTPLLSIPYYLLLQPYVLVFSLFIKLIFLNVIPRISSYIETEEVYNEPYFWPLSFKNKQHPITLLQKWAILFPLLCPFSPGVFFSLRFYLFIFRDRGRKRERKGEKHQCGYPHNLGMHPNWELNRQAPGSQSSTQSTEPRHTTGRALLGYFNKNPRCHIISPTKCLTIKNFF